MARISMKKTASKSPHSKKQREILQALETAARRTGFKVSAGQLRFAGLKLRGGSCSLRGTQWLILDKNQPFDELVDIYRQALSLRQVNECGLPGTTVELLTPYLGPEISTPAGEAA